MRLGVIADDFTGASDIGNVIARATLQDRALRVVQYFGVPPAGGMPDVDAAVLSLKFRSVPAADAVAQALAALAWLQAQGAAQIIYKYCSTFDSTPAGNIGPVGEALAAALGARGILACPSFPATGRTVYQGHLFVNGRLLNESGLENHPLNPMSDPYLPRWLALQTQSPVGLVPHQTVTAGATAVSEALQRAAAAGEVLVIADAINERDLDQLARAAVSAPLVTGGSAIAGGLARLALEAGAGGSATARTMRVGGRAVVLAGSCSTATRRQIATYRTSHVSLFLDAADTMSGKLKPDDVVAFARLHAQDALLIYSSVEPAVLAELQARFGGARLAERFDRFFADATRLLIEDGVTRLVVAGGETSGAVASAIGRGSVEIGPEIAPGVPLLYAPGDPPLALALKSGNFGGDDFFARALEMMDA